MKSLTLFIESKIQEVYQEKQRLEKELNSLGKTDSDIIKGGEINSKLFWLGKMSGKLKDDMEEYRALTEQINIIAVNPKSGGIDKYFQDLEKWENSFYCNECGSDKVTDFSYSRTVSNGEVHACKNCKTETVVSEKPNEDKY